MLLSIAFLMFAMLVVGWLFVPERGTTTAPSVPGVATAEPAPSQA